MLSYFLIEMGAEIFTKKNHSCILTMYSVLLHNKSFKKIPHNFLVHSFLWFPERFNVFIMWVCLCLSNSLSCAPVHHVAPPMWFTSFTSIEHLVHCELPLSKCLLGTFDIHVVVVIYCESIMLTNNKRQWHLVHIAAPLWWKHPPQWIPSIITIVLPG